MGEMEEVVLQNSKGAPYMSFVLDVEVVLKTKKGVMQANLAESKVKSESKVPTTKEQEDKPVKPKEENKNILTPKPEKKKNVTSPPPQKEDLRIYTATMDPNNIFVEQRKFLPEVKSSNRLEDERSTSVKQSELAIAPEIENRKKSRAKHNIKKNIKKVDRKSKVFKGKIEKIDFLECNRIFMCNYFKIQNHKLPNTRENGQSQNEPNTITSNTQVVDRNCKFVSNPKSIFTTFDTLVNNIKKSKLLTKSGTVSFMVTEIPQRNSKTGDCANINSKNCLKHLPIANLKRKDNTNTSWLSLNYFKTGNCSSYGQHKKYCSKRYTSCQNVFSNNVQLFHKTIIQRNKSLPNNYYVQELSGYKISHKITEEFSVCYNLNEGKNKTSVKSYVPKNITNYITDNIYKDLAGFEVKFVHDSQTFSRPNIYRETRSKYTSKKHKLKGVTSICEISNVKQEFIPLRSKSLNHVNLLYKESNSGKLESSRVNNHITILQNFDHITMNKPKKKRSIWKIINSCLFKCFMKQYDWKS
uniref:Uncharacterized protein n=1 Tax=Graphocephala atropunctata TaxID=36148 RepID=A0A1B6M8M4_9HEMI